MVIPYSNYNGPMKRVETAVQANLRNAKALIVEDNDDQYVLISQAMQACLPEVSPVRVSSVQQALSLLAEWRHQEWELPQLILLDLYLPTSVIQVLLR